MAFPDGPKMVTEPITTSGDLGDSVSSFFPNQKTDMFWLTSCRSLFFNIYLSRWAWSVRWILIHHLPTPGLRVILARFEKGNSFLQFWIDHNIHFQAVGSSQNLTVIVSRRSEGQVTFSCLSGRKFCSSITKSCSLQYLCHSMTDGFPLLSSKPASILLQGPPVIQSPQVRGRCWKWWWLWIMTLSICVKAC